MAVTLDPPITLECQTCPEVGGRKRAVQFDTLSVTIIDTASRRVCHAHIGGCRQMLLLWSGDAYDAAGDYTQAQAEDRLREVLGDNPAAVLQALL
jgi:hypothetical protein